MRLTGSTSAKRIFVALACAATILGTVGSAVRSASDPSGNNSVSVVMSAHSMDCPDIPPGNEDWG